MQQCEIKFRVWDEGKMWTIDDMMAEGVLFILLPTGAVHQRVPRCKKCPDAVALQYTGLTDAMGQEIYEGDVMEGADHGAAGGNAVRSAVVYNAPWFEMQPGVASSSGLTTQWLQEEARVIGNIYENPDLLSQ